MKQSNFILGVGILVAVILIAGSFFLKASPREQFESNTLKPTQSYVTPVVKNIAIKPIQKLIRRIVDIQ